MKHTASLAVPLTLAIAAGLAWSKLPPPSDEAKAKAAETAAKNAYNDKVAAYKLCQSQDRVAAAYFAEAKKAGKPASAPVASAACADPGPFSYPPPEGKPPLEAAGAHSPPHMAAAPPSTTQPAAEKSPKR